MRGGLIAVAFLALSIAGAAHAQETLGAVGPFQLGMAQEEAIALAPSAPWASADELSASEYADRVPYLKIGPTPYAVHVHFDRGRVSMIRLGDVRPMPTSSACEAALMSAVEAIEPSIGRMSGRALSHETGAGREERRTPMGSRVRFYTQQETSFRAGHANLRAEGAYVIARSEFKVAGETQTGPVTICRILFEFYVDPFAPPSEAEFAMAHMIETSEAPAWLERPDRYDFAQYYPRIALEQGRSGRVVLDCLINEDGTLACRVEEESPDGYGFGNAARLISTAFRMALPGGPRTHRRIRLPIAFSAQR